MKAIVAIVLVSLLGLLGCGGSDGGTNTIGQAIPVAPFGIIGTPTPTYEWTPVSWATKYRLLVQDTNETPKIDEWYTAEESGCESEDSLCMAKPVTWVFGEYEFKVQACANEECGLWSEPLKFDSSPTPLTTITRFTDNGDDTVTDNHTKLMWSKNANPCVEKDWDEKDWYAAHRCCDNLTLARHSDWRLPSLNELRSLIDDRQYDPPLPPGNPFTHVQSHSYWSSTSDECDPSRAWIVYMHSGDVNVFYKDAHIYVWPVRSDN